MNTVLYLPSRLVWIISLAYFYLGWLVDRNGLILLVYNEVVWTLVADILGFDIYPRIIYIHLYMHRRTSTIDVWLEGVEQS